jgi:hypothetical protein
LIRLTLKPSIKNPNWWMMLYRTQHIYLNPQLLLPWFWFSRLLSPGGSSSICLTVHSSFVSVPNVLHTHTPPSRTCIYAFTMPVFCTDHGNDCRASLSERNSLAPGFSP